MRFLMCLMLSAAPLLSLASEPTFEGLLTPLPVGFSQLRILTPEIIELTLITTKKPDPARVEGVPDPPAR